MPLALKTKEVQINKEFWRGEGHLDLYQGDSLVLLCASLLCMQFALFAHAHERMLVQNIRDFPQTKLDSKINALFPLNEHGGPTLFIS